MQEELWHVHIINNALQVSDPKNSVKSIQLEDIKIITIQTNDSGPFGSDVLWFVSDGNFTISFPMGASGESEVLAFFQTLNGFDNQELINAMGSTDNKTFTLLNNTTV